MLQQLNHWYFFMFQVLCDTLFTLHVRTLAYSCVLIDLGYFYVSNIKTY